MSTTNNPQFTNFTWNASKWNSSTSNVASFESFMSLPGIKATFITLYVVVLISSLIGNGTVIFSVIRVKKLQTVRNLFILNLAVADILLGSLSTPITPLSYYLKSWVLGEFLCSLLPICFGAFAHVSTLTCAVIAIHRYSQIVMPAGRQISKRLCFVTSFAIWILGVSIGIPPGVYAEVLTFQEYSYCVENWPSFDDRTVYSTTDFFILFVIPCAIITFCYVKVWKAMGLYDGMVTSYLQLEDGDLATTRRTNKMLVLMIVVFVVCWLPVNVLFLISEFDPDIFSFTAAETAYFIAHVLAMSSTVWNPVIYAGMDKSFQSQFRKIFLPILMSTGMRTRTDMCTNVSAEPEITENDFVEYACDSDSVTIVPSRRPS